jgi:hypothetical protein
MPGAPDKAPVERVVLIYAQHAEIDDSYTQRALAASFGVAQGKAHALVAGWEAGLRFEALVQPGHSGLVRVGHLMDRSDPAACLGPATRHASRVAVVAEVGGLLLSSPARPVRLRRRVAGRATAPPMVALRRARREGRGLGGVQAAVATGGRAGGGGRGAQLAPPPRQIDSPHHFLEIGSLPVTDPAAAAPLPLEALATTVAQECLVATRVVLARQVVETTQYDKNFQALAIGAAGREAGELRRARCDRDPWNGGAVAAGRGRRCPNYAL